MAISEHDEKVFEVKRSPMLRGRQLLNASQVQIRNICGKNDGATRNVHLTSRGEIVATNGQCLIVLRTERSGKPCGDDVQLGKEACAFITKHGKKDQKVEVDSTDENHVILMSDQMVMPAAAPDESTFQYPSWRRVVPDPRGDEYEEGADVCLTVALEKMFATLRKMGIEKISMRIPKMPEIRNGIDPETGQPYKTEYKPIIATGKTEVGEQVMVLVMTRHPSDHEIDVDFCREIKSEEPFDGHDTESTEHDDVASGT